MKPKSQGDLCIEPQDHVYVQHPKRGALAVRVLSCGKDGLTGKCDAGERHKVLYDQVLGVKARAIKKHTVVDQGAEGALIEDESGRRRYIAGELPAPPEPEPEPTAATDDPLTGGMDRLKKASDMMIPDGAKVFFAAGR